MTTTTNEHGPHVSDAAAATDDPARPGGPNAYDARVAALAEAYHRTVDHIMTTRYGPGWTTRGDLPDEAYTAETTFHQWLNDLLDHIDNAATKASPPDEI